MTLRTTLAALTLALLPGLAIARCTDDHGKTSASVCAEGTIWDTTTQTCVPRPTT
jgi:hypothetical protein